MKLPGKLLLAGPCLKLHSDALMDRRISVGPTGRDCRKHRMPRAGAPNIRPGTLRALQLHMRGRPNNPAAPRRQARRSWQLHCPRQRLQQLQRQRRRRPHNRNNVPRPAAPPTEKPPRLWRRQVQARSCSSGRLLDISVEPATPAGSDECYPLRFRRFLSNF
jgi:hypothetical protein